MRAAFVATRSVAGSYEIDFRIIIGDEIRWISARGQGNAAMTGKPDVTGVTGTYAVGDAAPAPLPTITGNADFGTAPPVGAVVGTKAVQP